MKRLENSALAYTCGEGSAVAWWLINASDSGSRGRGFEPHSGQTVLCPEARHIYSQKVLVIPRKRWLSPNMTEKLFSWTLSINQLICGVLGHFFIASFTREGHITTILKQKPSSRFCENGLLFPFFFLVMSFVDMPFKPS